MRESGLNHAIGTAITALRRRAEAITIIPTDTPHVPPATIDTVAAGTRDGGVTIVPAIRDAGTNMLSMRPVGLILAAVRRRQLSPPLPRGQGGWRHSRGFTPVPWPAMISTGRAICSTFLSLGSGTRTHDYLAGLRIAERLTTLRRACLPADLVRACA